MNKRAPLEVYLSILSVCTEQRNMNDITRMANIPYSRAKLMIDFLIHKELLQKIPIKEFNNSKFNFRNTGEGNSLLGQYINIVTIFNGHKENFTKLPTLES